MFLCFSFEFFFINKVTKCCLFGGDHRFCVRHLYANYRDSGYKGLALKDKLWAAAIAYTES